jgi:2-polyprenyl-3-methyl-5-hydroxy-6-metoxy-1,4-benzoquinol methylase
VARLNFPFYAAAPKEIVTSCNLCGGNRFALYSLTDRYGLEAPSVQCDGCGLRFLSFRMTAEAYEEFYAGGHYRELLSQFNGHPMTAQGIERDQGRYAECLSHWLSPYVAIGGLLLDLGGSTGVVAARLAREYGLDATVVEASADEARRAVDKGLAVANVRLQDYVNGHIKYDLILLCRTVDHLLDIKGDLARIKGWLAPKGLFFVDFVHKTPPKIDHPYMLSKDTMRRYLEGAGFTVRALGYSDARHTNMLCDVA